MLIFATTYQKLGFCQKPDLFGSFIYADGIALTLPSLLLCKMEVYS
jgi:hypothetical protein